MNMKKCTKCRQEKPASTDYFGRQGDWFQNWCKQCKKEHHAKNKDEINRKRRERRREEHPVEVLPPGMKRCSSCEEVKPTTEYGKMKRAKDGLKYSCKACRREKEYLANKDYIIEKQKNYYNNNKEKTAETTKAYKQKRKEWYKEYHKKYYAVNADAIKENVKNNHLNRLNNDIGYKILCRSRARLYKALKGTVKSQSTKDLIGCSVEDLLRHLESQFKAGMTWDNYGEWHVDHIKPCASFDFTDPAQQKECFHYSNLQPLWAEENQSKSNKYDIASD